MKEKCCIEKCESVSYCRKMCVKHYLQYKRMGHFTSPLYSPRDGKCKVDGCTAPIESKGRCSKHAQRFRKFGDDSVVKNDHYLSIKERLLKNKEIKDNGCWEWTKYKDKDGYGNISIKDFPQKAHRVSYKEFVGEIPEGMQVLHKCDNPSCINPDHLFLGTNDDNMEDMVNKGRSLRGEKQPRHKLTERDIKEMRMEFKKFVPFKQESFSSQCNRLAKIYGVSGRLVRNIYDHKAWKHVI